MVLTPKTPNLQDHFLLGSQIHRYLYIPCRGEGGRELAWSYPPSEQRSLQYSYAKIEICKLDHIPNFMWPTYPTSSCLRLPSLSRRTRPAALRQPAPSTLKNRSGPSLETSEPLISHFFRNFALVHRTPPRARSPPPFRNGFPFSRARER